MYKEFEKTLGGRFDKNEIKKIIKEREESGYAVMTPQEAESYWSKQRKINKIEEYKKSTKKIEELFKKQGFV